MAAGSIVAEAIESGSAVFSGHGRCKWRNWSSVDSYSLCWRVVHAPFSVAWAGWYAFWYICMRRKWLIGRVVHKLNMLPVRATREEGLWWQGPFGPFRPSGYHLCWLWSLRYIFLKADWRSVPDAGCLQTASPCRYLPFSSHIECCRYIDNSGRNIRDAGIGLVRASGWFLSVRR